jgi:hypothetical protein
MGTVKVRFLVSIGGVDFTYTPDTVYDLSTAEAEKWCDGVRAEYVDAPASVKAKAKVKSVLKKVTQHGDD